MKIIVQTEVSKEAHELGQSLVELVKAVKVALADGWQPGTDLPVIVSAAFSKLPEGVQGVDQLDDEAKEDLAAFASAFALTGKDLAAVFLKKE